MNKNSKNRVDRARDAFGRIKQALFRAVNGQRGTMVNPQDEILAQTVGHRDRKSKKPKVAASAAAMSKGFSR
jgi:hypothetical protein